MSWFDVALLAVVVLSSVLSLMRGFTKEMLSLAGWVLAFWIAAQFGYLVERGFEDWIHHDDIRKGAAFLTLFLVVLVASMIFNRLIVRLIRGSILNGADRSLGVLFGALRGVVIVTVFVLVLGMTPLSQDDLWRDSMFAGRLQHMAEWLGDYLPNQRISSVRLW